MSKQIKSTKNIIKTGILTGALLISSLSGTGLMNKAEASPERLTIVESGDTLWRISYTHNITVKELKRLNNLKDDTIYVGQELKLVEDGVNATYPEYTGKPIFVGTNHLVLTNDTLWSIARKHNTTVERIKSINKLKNNNIYVGQVLKIK